MLETLVKDLDYVTQSLPGFGGFSVYYTFWNGDEEVVTIEELPSRKILVYTEDTNLYEGKDPEEAVFRAKAHYTIKCLTVDSDN